MESSEDIAVSSSGERVPCLASPHNDSHYKFAQVKVTNTIVGVILFLKNVLSCASGQRDPLLSLARSAAKALPGFTFLHLVVPSAPLVLVSRYLYPFFNDSRLRIVFLDSGFTFSFLVFLLSPGLHSRTLLELSGFPSLVTRNQDSSNRLSLSSFRALFLSIKVPIKVPTVYSKRWSLRNRLLGIRRRIGPRFLMPC
jgi:hypothetical protein